ncbi:MAG: murein biosynthesis integral membrane protein MurJ [Candidatus Andeanibacterium colombiense]|uniref:Probable lipid II flippase MurJ n=1 Tax=Candidatus Andeanibacterium colombiense TaxID=3121345 RepID=A0AAJ5X9H4_9SPHN|nr:MAG: murein biosynthesis integral membrane protein MurJ [Sphingomonadaceae bacterium]
MSLIRNVGTIGGLTAVSRVFGFMRDMLFARLFGAGLAADAFQLAFTLPNTFRRLFAEGAFSVAFVPMYGKKLHGEDGEREAGIFANDVLSVFVWVLFGFSVLCILGMEGIVWLLAREYQHIPGKFELSVTLARITFPYLGLVSVVALLSGILNTRSRFGPGAVAPVLFNFALIGGLLWGWYFDYSDRLKAFAQSWALPVAGLLQLVFLLWSLKRSGVGLKIHWPRMTPDTKVLLWRIFPATFGAGIYQISQLADTFFATSLPQGSLTLLKMGDRLNQMPLGIVGIALGTAILPALSRHIAGGDQSGAAKLQGRAIELATLLTLPSAAALAVCAPAFVNAFFVGGKFTAHDGAIMTEIVVALVCGLPSYVLVKVLEPGYFSRGDTRTPVMTAASALAFNIFLNLAVVRQFGIVGLAGATACSASLNCVLLYANLHRRNHFRFSLPLAGRILRQLLAAGVMAVALWFLLQATMPWYSGTVASKAGGIVLLVVVGLVVYGAAALLFRAFDQEDLRMLRRKSKRTIDEEIPGF